MKKIGMIVLVSIIMLSCIGIASAATSSDPSGAGIIPTQPSGNDRKFCNEGALGFDTGVSLISFNQSQIQALVGQGPTSFNLGFGTLTLKVYETASGQAFDWAATFPVEKIAVHGGGTNIYDYTATPATETSDTLLHAPCGGNSHTWAILSVIDFCNEDIPTPEFPTVALPVGMIVGFLGIVTFVRGKKE